jgi:membrane protease YdiL (CAAX protease family)
MEKQKSSSSSFRDLSVFIVIFFCVWIAAVTLIWKSGFVAEPLRPWARTAIWIGAGFSWTWWQKLPRPCEWLGLVPVSRWALTCSVGVFCALIILNVLRIQIVMAPTHHLLTWTAPQFVWSFTGVFAEELVFRGVILVEALILFSPFWAIILSAILFVFIHIPGWVLLSLPVDGLEVATVFLVGLIAGWLRWATGSIWPAVAAHWANNIGAAL